LADLETQWAQHKKELEGDVKKSIDDYNTLYKSKNFPAIVIL
jgi:hypothetical protein